jgi:hypothetical protein
MPLQVIDQWLFKLGCDLSFFELDKNWGTALTSDNWDDLIHKVYVKEGTIELNNTSSGTFTSRQSLDFTIIDLCLKWWDLFLPVTFSFLTFCWHVLLFTQVYDGSEGSSDTSLPSDSSSASSSSDEEEQSVAPAGGK